MDASIPKETFRETLAHPRVVELARRVIRDGYVECAGDRAVDMGTLVDRAFDLLLAACEDEGRFRSAVATIVGEVFRKQDPHFWFNRVYGTYKREIKPGLRLEKLRPWLSGPSVLDVGCGDGLLSNRLRGEGYAPVLTDVLDYRHPRAHDLPFASMVAAHALPFSGEHFDTGLVFAVLHHVGDGDRSALLAALRERCRELIVEEDTFGLPEDLPPDVLAHDAHIRSFTALPLADQFRMLMFIDYFANAITQGIPQMNMPFNFKTVSEWDALFEAAGFRVLERRIMGFQPRQFNRSCHVWWRLRGE